MSKRLGRLICLSALFGAVCAPAWAESFASSASSAGSASIGSLSDSVQGSSRSSSGETKVAEGEYRVVDVAVLADRPDMLQLTLQATATPGQEGELRLTLPQQALGRRGLSAGDVVHARHRPYGIEFARAAAATPQGREAFFLVLADDWRRELDPQRLQL